MKLGVGNQKGDRVWLKSNPLIGVAWILGLVMIVGSKIDPSIVKYTSFQSIPYLIFVIGVLIFFDRRFRQKPAIENGVQDDLDQKSDENFASGPDKTDQISEENQSKIKKFVSSNFTLRHL